MVKKTICLYLKNGIVDIPQESLNKAESFIIIDLDKKD